MRVASKGYFTRRPVPHLDHRCAAVRQKDHLGFGFKQCSLDHASLALTVRRYDGFATSGLAPAMLLSLKPFGIR